MFKKFVTAAGLSAALFGAPASAGETEDYIFYVVCEGDPICFAEEMTKAELHKCLDNFNCFGPNNTIREFIEDPEEAIEEGIDNILENIF